MRRIHVFRAGRHTPMAGGTLEFSEADLEATARAYDPARHEAPIVVGHPRLDAPAYGWVGGLSAEGGDLFAAPRQVEPAFAELVGQGRFKKVSAAFFKPDHPSNPVPGTYYLKHLGFLGAVPPAVKGLKPVEFAEDADATVTVEFAGAEAWLLGAMFADVAGLLRGVRDHLVAQGGVEAAEAVIPGARLQQLAEDAARLRAAPADEAAAPAAAPPPAFAEAPPRAAPNPNPETTRVTPEQLAERERALAEREAAFAEREAATRREADRAFVDGLVGAARLPAGLAPRVVAFMDTLAAEGEVAFAEGGRTVKETPREAFRALLSALPATVAFGEAAGGEGPGAGDAVPTAEFAGHRVVPERMELYRRAVAYRKAHPEVDFEAAVLAVEQVG